MSKIICDVCGTSYPESAAQCPICGCVRSAEAGVVKDVSVGERPYANSEYVHVKGGRFSKANVKKRNSSAQIARNDVTDEGKDKKDTGLVIAICALALAIVAVVIYILLRFFYPAENDRNEKDTLPADSVVQTIQTTAPSEETTVPVIPCTSIKISSTVVEMKKLGGIRLLNVSVLPADTTDLVSFTSSDETVAVVNNDGKIEAVGPGEAMITVLCGDISEVCRVVCDFEVETTAQETEETTVPATEPDEEFKLLKEDVTLSYKGESWICYNGDISRKDIEWSSDDEKIATVEEGKVVAVATGTTTIRAKYNGEEAKCIVRCSESVGNEEVNETTQEESEATSEPTTPKNYSISATDVTISVGERFDLIFKDEEGYPLDVVWQVSNDSCSAEGNIITGKSAGMAIVTAVYDNTELSCIVRVRG